MKTWISKHPDLWEFIKFTLLGAIASVIELLSFSLFNCKLFTGLKSVPFHWFVFDYSPTAGGLGTFLALSCSYGLGQIANFFVQRKLTFKATNNQAASAIMFAISVVAIYLFVAWLPTLFMDALYQAVGQQWGAILTKFICMTSGFLIQFPLNKYVIMAKKPQKEA